MSTPSPRRIDLRAWSQELRTSGKTQGALLILVLALGYLLWPQAPKRKASSPVSPGSAPTPAGEQSLDRLQKLPDLTQLDRAGELPTEGRVYRDIFLFDMPPPPPPPPPKPPAPQPPPPPPTEEELAAMKLAQARQSAIDSRPQNLRYLGYLGRPSTGRIGAFVRGDETLALRLGDTAGSNWKLVTLTESFAEFQHQTFPDIRHRIDAKDQATAAGTPVTNQF